MTEQRLAVGVDVGGTKISAGVVDEDGQILDRVDGSTPGTDRIAVLDAITDAATELMVRHRAVRAVGVGAAGFVDASQSTVVFAPHIDWRNEPLREAVSRRVGLPSLVDNDANCAGWAEYRFGAAQNRSDVVMLTLGTGIGGSIVFDGQPYRGHFGVAGEFGHMQVVPEGLACPCGQLGCLEQYASGQVLTRKARAAAAEHTQFGDRLLAEAGGLDALGGRHVTAAAQAGDPEAIEWIADVGRWLGVGMANVSAGLDPEIFVVGGGVCDADTLLLDPARAAYAARLTGRGFRPEAHIVKAHLGPDAGLIGAADMARRAARRRRRAGDATELRRRRESRRQRGRGRAGW